MTASESAGPAWSADFLQQSTAAWTQYLELGKSLLAQLDLGSKVGGFDGLSSALSGWKIRSGDRVRIRTQQSEKW